MQSTRLYSWLIECKKMWRYFTERQLELTTSKPTRFRSVSAIDLTTPANLPKLATSCKPHQKKYRSIVAISDLFQIGNNYTTPEILRKVHHVFPVVILPCKQILATLSQIWPNFIEHLLKYFLTNRCVNNISTLHTLYQCGDNTEPVKCSLHSFL